MRAFISWSGETSRLIAQNLREWLLPVVQTIEPWMSDRDILPGQRWNDVLSEQLSKTDFGIICLTPDNIASPWLLFEAGALAKSFKTAHLVPLLWQLAPADIPAPLAAFQSLRLDQDGARRLVIALSQKSGVDEKRVETAFYAHWPELDRRLRAIPEQMSERPLKRDREVLDEVLELTREMYRLSTKEGIASSLERWIDRLQAWYYYVDRQPTGGGAAERIEKEITALESALKGIREAQWRS